MGGVKFSEQAAQRISRAVVKVEGIPTPTNTQRNRAGGLGRMSLWEVTGVQTIPKTVTIDRVENQSGDLIQLSRKKDILFDPDNQPSLGDRGLLIRLGNGSLFFFKKEIPNFLLTNQYSFVSEEFPTVNFGNPTEARVRFNSTAPDREQWGFMKFASVGSGTFKDIILASITQLTIQWFGDAEFSAVQGGKLDIHRINVDFDPATITWNAAQTLSITSLGPYPFDLLMDTRFITVDSGKQYIFTYSTANRDLVANKRTLGPDPDLDGAFGLLFKASTTSLFLKMNVEIRFEFNDSLDKKTYAVKAIF